MPTPRLMVVLAHPDDESLGVVSCHESQAAAYARLKELSPHHHEALWGRQSFYRVFSTVNGGRAREADLFEGIPR